MKTISWTALAASLFSLAAAATRPYRAPFSEPLTSGNLDHFIVPHSKGPIRWTCAYQRDQVALPDPIRGTRITIGHNSTRKPYSCGELISRETHLDYGTYTVDMISSKTPGHVTGFFLIAPKGEAEIDIELTGLDSTVVWINIWKNLQQHPVKIPLGFDASEDWHTYAFDFRPDFIAWSIDGRQVWKRSDVKVVDPSMAPYKLALNSWTQAPGDTDWAGEFKTYREGQVFSQFRNLSYKP